MNARAEGVRILLAKAAQDELAARMRAGVALWPIPSFRKLARAGLRLPEGQPQTSKSFATKNTKKA
jgi:hypothetical protein